MVIGLLVFHPKRRTVGGLACTGEGSLLSREEASSKGPENDEQNRKDAAGGLCQTVAAPVANSHLQQADENSHSSRDQSKALPVGTRVALGTDVDANAL